MNEINAEYWRTRDGSLYLQQQIQRSEAGNRLYRQQEGWLEAFFAARSSVLGRPVKVLDFGCGFGRLARFLAQNPHVSYSGYDFSESMAAPLRADPPMGIDPTRIRVADSVNEAFPNETFDCIFTVAVLMHNEPGLARTLVWQMLEKLAEGGRLVLIENMLASISMRENNWHGGCWVHDHVGPYAPIWNIAVHRVLDEQNIYVYDRPPEGIAPQTSVVERDGSSRHISLDERLLLGLPRVEAAVRGLESEVASFAAAQAAQHDHEEEMGRLNREIDRLRKERDQLASVQSLRKKVEMAMAGFEPAPALNDSAQAERADVRHLFAPEEPSVERLVWDADRDTELAGSHPSFTRVCHVFHQEWVGIRAAAGALPGRKLAISASVPLSSFDIASVRRKLDAERIDRVVVHGFSSAMDAFIRGLHATGFDQIHLVWHGAAAMWVFEGERKLARAALTLVKKGKVRRMQGMRRGMDDVIGPRAFAPLLLNVAPSIPSAPSTALDRTHRRGGAVVMSPSWNLLHKNLVTNLLAAELNDGVGEFWTMARDLDLGAELSGKARTLEARSGRQMLETMRQADLIANVTIVDCHPMVDQEALAVGTPCLRGPLFLDALEDHPYVRATEVPNPLSVADISARMTYVLGVPTKEMAAMMSDYAAGIRAISYERYSEFLEIN